MKSDFEACKESFTKTYSDIDSGGAKPFSLESLDATLNELHSKTNKERLDKAISKF